MPTGTPEPDQFAAFRAGIGDGLPFLLVMVPFGMLFGVSAAEAGLDVVASLVFSVVVIAGASQFTALQLWQDHAPTLVVLLTSLAVNLRMAMYSAALTPHLGQAPVWRRALVSYLLVDMTYACAASRFERETTWGPGCKFWYFIGAALPICPTWFFATLAGGLLGQAIPESFALDFAVPICFLAIVAPMLRSLAHVLAAVTSIVLTLALAFIPWSLGLLIAAVVAMMVGAETERRMARRTA